MNENKNSRPKVSAFKNYKQMGVRRMQFGFFRNIMSVLRYGLVFLFALFLVSGLVNQRLTGETLTNYALHCGQKIGTTLNATMAGNGPVKITKDGIYLKNVEVKNADILEGTELDKPEVEKFNPKGINPDSDSSKEEKTDEKK